MYNTGFDDQAEFEQLLLSPHALRIELDVMDLEHNGFGSISSRFLGGQVDIDADAEITRSLKLQLLDHDRSLNFDKENPNEGAMYLDRMIQVHYCVSRLDLSHWYRVPVFTGPVTKVDRDGVVLNVECLGKEVLSNAPVWAGATYPKGYLRATLVKVIMQVVGETLFRFDESDSKTGAPTVLDKETSAMATARKVANAMGFQLFYNGAGVLVLRKRTSRPVWSFDARTLVDVPQVGFDLATVINAVDFTGAKPKGKKKPIRARVTAPVAHALSPSSLGRNGKPRHLPKYLEDTKVKKLSEAQSRAQAELNEGLKQAVDAAANSIVIPHLEEQDDIEFIMPEYVAGARLGKLTIPLTASGAMSVGYNKSVTPSKLAKSLRRV